MKEIYVKLGVIMTIFLVLVCSVQTKKQNAPETEEIEDTPVEEVKEDIVTVSMDTGESRELEVDTYLVGVVAGEMPASFEMEALKAQVVASRTFVYKRGLQVDNTTNTQVYLTDEKMLENWGEQYEEKKQKIEQAIMETKGEVMLYQGEYISALFFSSCNGYTENSSDYFIGGDIPYLQSVESAWDLEVDPNVVRSKSYTKEELQTIFECESVSFTIVSYKESGRIETIEIDGKEYTGREVREKLSLYSSSFTITLENGSYTFTCVGNGHGVGMSQYGAQGMALEGYSYQEILNHYYTNIEIVKK